MRTLHEIIEAIKSNQETTHEECLYSVLVLEALWGFDSRTVMRHLEIPEFMRNESFRRAKFCLNKSPQEWLGWDHDPKNPVYQKTRERNIKIFENLLEKVQHDKKDI